MDAFSGEAFLLVLGVIVFAGVVHGTFGLGFPMVATPMLALLADVQTAILLTLVPNIAVNLWSMLRGGEWGNSLGRFWPVAVWMLLGAFLGTLVLTSLDPNPFRLLLAAVILVYLLNPYLRFFSWSWVSQHPQASGAGAGLLAGFLGGTVNVGGPALMIYFLEMRVPPIVWVQAINLAFLLGKIMQTATFAALGFLTVPWWFLSLPLTGVALLGLRAGMWIRERQPAERYRRGLQGLLWVLMVLLIVQFLYGGSH